VELRGSRGERLIFDAGSGIRALGAHLVASGETAAAHLFLSHCHSDHVLGLAHFAPLFTASAPMHVYCGLGDHASLPAFIGTLLSPPLFPYVEGVGNRLAFAASDGSAACPVGGLEVHRHAARHPGEAAVFRVDDARGPLFAYAPDNEIAYHDDAPAIRAWRASLRRYLRDVPILVHDATYTDDELPRHRGWGHSSNVEATRLAIECGAATLVLFHHHPDRDDAGVDRMLEECRALVTREGASLWVLAASEGMALVV
jgi:phosphoribosyl 1,2-cyclic phosphodiesterase